MLLAETKGRTMQKTLLSCIGALTICTCALGSSLPSMQGTASWYGEAHRGRLMANGKKFDPDKLTAASWFYPLGTRVRVTASSNSRSPRSVLVTITDRGPAHELVRDGRVIDLGHAAFRQLADPDLGLVRVKVQPLPKPDNQRPSRRG
jgi:rare lipoprotein A